MKTTVTTLLITLSSVAVAQNTAIQKAGSVLCQTELSRVQAENEYLKKSLNVLTPIKTVEQDELEIKLVKCEGNIKEQTITIGLILTSHKANSEFQFSSSQTIDLQGRELNPSGINLGKESVRNTLFTDTPIQATFKFIQVLPSIKILKIFSASYYDVGLFKRGNFQIKDIEVNWK